MSDTPTPPQSGMSEAWAAGLPTGDDSITSTIISFLDDVDPAERENAGALALARHDAAWQADGDRHWRDLSASERIVKTVDALHSLRAARSTGLAP